MINFKKHFVLNFGSKITAKNNTLTVVSVGTLLYFVIPFLCSDKIGLALSNIVLLYVTITLLYRLANRIILNTFLNCTFVLIYIINFWVIIIHAWFSEFEYLSGLDFIRQWEKITGICLFVFFLIWALILRPFIQTKSNRKKLSSKSFLENEKD